MIDFEEIIVLRDEKNKQKARYAKHRKDAQKKARHRVSYVTGGEKLLQTERYNCGIGDDFDEWVPIVKRLVAAMTA